MGVIPDNSPSSGLLSSIEETPLRSSKTKNNKLTGLKTPNADLARVLDEHLENQTDYVERMFREVFGDLDAKLRKLEDQFA